jgi:hypothetical protein
MTFAAGPVFVRRMTAEKLHVRVDEIDFRRQRHRERLSILIILKGGLVGLRVRIRNAIEKKPQPFLFSGSFTSGSERETNEGEKNDSDDPLGKTRNAERGTRKTFPNGKVRFFHSEFRVPRSPFQWSVHWSVFLHETEDAHFFRPGLVDDVNQEINFAARRGELLKELHVLVINGETCREIKSRSPA